MVSTHVSSQASTCFATVGMTVSFRNIAICDITRFKIKTKAFVHIAGIGIDISRPPTTGGEKAGEGRLLHWLSKIGVSTSFIFATAMLHIDFL